MSKMQYTFITVSQLQFQVFSSPVLSKMTAFGTQSFFHLLKLLEGHTAKKLPFLARSYKSSMGLDFAAQHLQETRGPCIS